MPKKHGILAPRIMLLKVETLPGTHGDREPHAFLLGETRMTVDTILDRWIGQKQNYFKLIAGDGAIYILRHDLGSDDWKLALYQAVRDSL